MRHTWPSRTEFLESSLDDGIGAADRVGNRVIFPQVFFFPPSTCCAIVIYRQGLLLYFISNSYFPREKTVKVAFFATRVSITFPFE